MHTKGKSFLALTVFMAFIATAFFLSGVSVGGELEPPDTVPTMPTTENIYQGLKITNVPRGFVIWEENPRFAIWENDPSKFRDDVVLDRATDLIWMRDPCHMSKMTYYNAKDQVQYKEIGYGKIFWSFPLQNDKGEITWFTWKIPNASELLTLIGLGTGLPSKHPFERVEIKVNFDDNCYWTSSDDYKPNDSVTYWDVVNIESGYAFADERWGQQYYVWPVSYYVVY